MWLMLSAASWAQSVSLEPLRFPIQTKVSMVLEITPGPEGFVPGDVVLIDEPVYHGQRNKWGWLSQRSALVCEPLSRDFASSSAGRVDAVPPAGVSVSVLHSEDSPRNHEMGQILVTVVSGTIGPDQVLRVLLGTEEEQGNCGWQTPARTHEQVPLKVSYWPASADQAVEIDTLMLAFEAESEVVEVSVSMSSQAQVGVQQWVRVSPLDRLGNLAQGEEVLLLPHTFEKEGVFRVPVDAFGESLWSNPVRVTQEAPEWGVFWGDLHTHHGHSYVAADGSWVDENHDYARDVMGLDFGCESVKGDPIELNSDGLWESVQRSCSDYSVDGEYLALLGFEWMGNDRAGHHNVYYETCEGPLIEQELPGLDRGLWLRMEETMAETGQRMISIPHAPSFTGFDWDEKDEVLRPVAEVFSEWGNSMEPERAGSVPEGLSAGQRLGFIASSDNHDGWLGNPMVSKNTPGGLAAILAPSLSTGEVLTALSNRSSYATTGARILLELVAWEEGVPHPMGSAFLARDTRIDWKVHGTAPIDSVRLVSAGVGAQETGLEWASWSPGELDAQGSAQVPDGPRELAMWIEVTQSDREMAWSSPVWLERAKVEEPSGCSGGLVGALGMIGGLGLGSGLARRRRR